MTSHTRTALPPDLPSDGPPDLPDDEWWYAGVRRDKKGPFSLDALVEALLEEHSPTGAPGAMVWRAGLAAWRPARDVPEIADELARRARSDGWYFGVGAKREGPFELDALVAEMLRGRSPSGAAALLVWRDGMENWTPAREVPAVSDRLRQKGPPDLPRSSPPDLPRSGPPDLPSRHPPEGVPKSVRSTPALPEVRAAAAGTFDDWDKYVFAEAELPSSMPIIQLLDHPSSPDGIPSPSEIDPEFAETRKLFTKEYDEFRHKTIQWSEVCSLNWMHKSPFEIFLAQVLAKKLSTLK